VARFCLACGGALAPTRETEEERKIVTALFTDVVGSTASAEQLDPEDVHARLSPYYARVRSEIEWFGGTVEKFIGDAVVAVFGAPVAREDDPERAVRAAIAVHGAIAELNAQDEWLDLHIRTAVHTGEALVVVGARPTEGEGIASGDVMNTAARLQGVAPVNGIVVGEDTYRATRHAVEYRDADPVRVKGKAEPVRVWHVVGMREEAPARRAADAPLVGREAECGALLELWQRIQDEGRPVVATVVGAPGIGKSRLLAELAARVEDAGAVYRGKCLSYGEGITYWPVIEIVRDAAGILQSDDAVTSSAKLEALLGRLPIDDADQLRTIASALANLVGVPSTPRGTYSAAQISKSELHWGIRRLLELLAADRPLLLVLEDLHWAEPTLIDLIRFLAQGEAPLLILASARPELSDLAPDLLVDDGSRRVIELDALSEGESTLLLQQLLGPAGPGADVLEGLLRNAGGNPLFLEETVGMLVEEGAAGAAEGLPVPSSLQALIASRLDRLPPQAKRVARAASVVGTVFWSAAVAELAETNGGLEDALAELERRDIVREREVSSVAGEREFAFKHGLIRDVAYAGLPKGRRVELHSRVSDWVSALPGPEDEFVEIVAYHLEQACRLARELARSPLPPPVLGAANALAQAAEKAQRREGWSEASRYYDRALELMGADHPEVSLELRLRRARTLAGLGELKQACEELEAVAQESPSLGRFDLRCFALVTLGNIDQRLGRPSSAGERLMDAQALASEVGDRSLEIRSAFALAALRADFEGAFDDAVADLRGAVRAAEEIDDHELLIEGQLRLGFLLYNMGGLAEAEEALLRCIELAGELGSHRDEARAVFQLGLVKYYRGDLEEAVRLNLQTRDWLERTHEPYFQIQNFRALGLYALAQDDPTAAERWLREAIPIALEEGGRYILEVYRFLTQALVRQGRIEDADALASFAARSIPMEDVAAQAYVLLAQADVAAAKGERDIVVGSYEQALRRLEDQHLPIEVGEARLAYARALRWLGDLGRAAAELALARETFESLGAIGLVGEVDRELEAVAGGTGGSGPPRSP
jgi:class 3 adenylate cyclase/tetratricopeptide (TPR) repeat protein